MTGNRPAEQSRRRSGSRTGHSFFHDGQFHEDAASVRTEVKIALMGEYDLLCDAEAHNMHLFRCRVRSMAAGAGSRRFFFQSLYYLFRDAGAAIPDTDRADMVV